MRKRFAPEKMKAMRVRKGLNRETLAVLAGLSPRTIANYETGQSTPDVNSAERVASALGTLVVSLMEEAKDE